MMTFTIKSNVLNETLAMLVRVINSKNVLPILGDIVFSVKGDMLTLKASDGETTITTDIDLLSADGEGCFSVNSKDIFESVRSLGEQELTFSVEQDNSIVKIDYFTGVFNLPTTNAEEFPAAPELPSDTLSLSVTEQVLQLFIARSIFALANDELRPIMNGVYFHLTTEGLAVVSSDGHKLVRNRLFDVKADDDSQVSGFVLPKKPATILKNILKKSDDMVEIIYCSHSVIFKAANFTMQCRLIEGRYPNYNSVIPKNNNNIAVIDRMAFISAMKRVMPFSNVNSELVVLDIENDHIQLTAEDYDYSKIATEKVSCSYNGPSIRIGFKGSSVIDALDNINSSELEIQLADPSRAALIVPSEQVENMDILILQMPMLVS